MEEKQELSIDAYFGKEELELSLEDIISGQDLSKHYLDETNKQFKIYRFKQKVFAVRFNEKTAKPIDYVLMWHSHKGEPKVKPTYLGSGSYGHVYQKTEDKAFKELKRKGRTKEKSVSTNLTILEQKFFLKENNLEKFFVLGLWNINKDILFYMPVINTQLPKDFKSDKLKSMFDEFILALKKLNELGYSHPDLALTLYHYSLQNICITLDGIKLIDLDSGLHSFNKEPLSDYARKRDQWIYVYNNQYDTAHWRKELKNWYDLNPGLALSDYPEWLFYFYKKGILSLPNNFINEMHLVNAKESVSEYLEGSNEDRKHEFYEVSTEDFSSLSHKEEYKELKGDALKRAILKGLKDSLKNIKTLDELEEIKSKFFKSPEIKIIDKAQGRTIHTLGFFGVKTDSRLAVEEIFTMAEKRINNNSFNV